MVHKKQKSYSLFVDEAPKKKKSAEKKTYPFSLCGFSDNIRIDDESENPSWPWILGCAQTTKALEAMLLFDDFRQVSGEGGEGVEGYGGER